MLHLKFKDSCDIPSCEIVRDNEILFATTKLTGLVEEKEAIRLLEEGEWLDPYSFIDRFGYKLPVNFLSMGCKTILNVLHNPEQWIDTLECGWNAISVLISICREGKIIVDDQGVSLMTYGLNTDIEVEVDGRVFRNTDDLNRYLKDER